MATNLRSTGAGSRFVAEDFFVFEASSVAVLAPTPRVPGALPLGSDADAGTDFDTEDAEDDTFKAIATDVDFVAEAAIAAAADVNSLNAAVFAVEDEFVDEDGCVVEGKYVAEDAFVPEAELGLNGACAGEECDVGEGSLTMWLPEVRALSSLPSRLSSIRLVEDSAAALTTATLTSKSTAIGIGAVSVSKASDLLLPVLVVYPLTCVMGHGP